MSETVEKKRTVKAVARPKPLGAVVDLLWAEREAKREKEAEIKTIEGRIEVLETELLERLEAEGLDALKGSKASISVGSAVTAKVEDWDSFHAYIGKNKFWHLLQRRVSDPAYRELLDMGKKVPGVQPFVKKRLNIRSL